LVGRTARIVDLAREGLGAAGWARSTTVIPSLKGLGFSIVKAIVKVVVYRLTTILTIKSSSDFRFDNRVAESGLSACRAEIVSSTIEPDNRRQSDCQGA